MEEVKRLSKLMKSIGKKNSHGSKKNFRGSKKKEPIPESKISATVKSFKENYKVKISKNGKRTFVPRLNNPSGNIITKQESCESNSSIPGSLSASPLDQSFELQPQNQTTTSDPANLSAMDEFWEEISRDFFNVGSDNPSDFDHLFTSPHPLNPFAS